MLEFSSVVLRTLLLYYKQTPINWPISRTNRVSQHQKGKTILDFNEARDDGVAVASAGLYAIHFTSLQTDNHTSNILQAGCSS